jgi:hypothetical protein
MNKIRLIFLILVLVVTVVFLSFFHKTQAPMDSKTGKISGFMITKISGNGKIYLHNRPIKEDLTALKPVDIRQMQYSEAMYLKADSHTSFEFYYMGTSFNILPKSYLYYHPQKKELHFFSGEFFWEKKFRSRAKKQSLAVYIREPRQKIILSDSGRVRLEENSTEIWNYSGALKLNIDGKEHNLTTNQLFVWTGSPSGTQRLSRRDQTPQIQIIGILPMPRNIDPAKSDIVLNNPDDSIVRFNWRTVSGTPHYIFRLYSSNLRENILVEKFLEVNRVNLDLLQFEERVFYWEAFPVDPVNQREGVPSKMGEIRLVGYLLGKKNVQKPPELIIKSLAVNGNLVLIKGKADPNSQLFINGESVKIELDGEFITTRSFKGLGRKQILFKLISPLGIETVEERYVTIYEE